MKVAILSCAAFLLPKLKLVKRQMYGRGKIDLLEARLVGAAWR